MLPIIVITHVDSTSYSLALIWVVMAITLLYYSLCNMTWEYLTIYWMKKIICNVYWQMPIMNVVAHYYYLEAKVVNYYCYLICLGVEFSWERVFVICYLSIYPAMNIIYLPLPNCSGNFNRFCCIINFARRYAYAFNAFELRFVVRVLLHHRPRFYPLPQSRHNLQLLLQDISDWSPGITASVPFFFIKK